MTNPQPTAEEKLTIKEIAKKAYDAGRLHMLTEMTDEEIVAKIEEKIKQKIKQYIQAIDEEIRQDKRSRFSKNVILNLITNHTSDE